MTLEQLQTLIAEKAAVLGLATDASVLPTYGRTEDFARPHIEVHDGGEYHYVVVERGVELERSRFAVVDDLLYRVFESVTFSLGSGYAARQRPPDEDFRRLLFARQLELLGLLSPGWRTRREGEIADILHRHP